MLKLSFQKKLLEAGCDEAGRGCLAGPVFAAAVILPEELKKDFKKDLKYFRKVDDSKKLTTEARKELRPIIEMVALPYAVGIVDVEKIDEINVLNASFLAMHRAIAQLAVEPELLLIDGNRFNKYYSFGKNKRSRPVHIPHQCIIEGDGKFLSIACASILAKTYRDDYMKELHKKFSDYKWNQNKGYATLEHRSAIAQFGANEHHRKSFTLLSSQIELDLNLPV